MRVFLHIGSEKTGTTAIQQWCGSNARFLREHGIHYPRALGQRNHVLLACYAAQGGRVADLRKLTGLHAEADMARFRAELPQRFREEAQAAGAPAILVSNEHLSSRLVAREEAERVRDFFRETVRDPEFKVILYVRRQDEMAQSTYSTYVKSGGRAAFRATPRLEDRRLNPLLVLDMWADVFGEENIVVRVFDRTRLVRGDIVHDLMRQIGVNIPEGREDLQPVREANARLGAEALEFLRLMNHHIPRFTESGLNPMHSRLVRLLMRLSGGRPARLMSAEEARRFVAHYDGVNREIARRFLRREDGVLFGPVEPADGPAEAPARFDLTAADAVRIAAYLWTHHAPPGVEGAARARARAERLHQRQERRARARRQGTGALGA